MKATVYGTRLRILDQIGWVWYAELGNLAMRTHSPRVCVGRRCVIHNPSDNVANRQGWPYNWRGDRGLMERICTHGVGHPDVDDVAWQNSVYPERAAAIHGCCQEGCCARN